MWEYLIFWNESERWRPLIYPCTQVWDFEFLENLHFITYTNLPISFRLQIHKVCDIFDNKTYHYISALLFRSDSCRWRRAFFAQIFLSMTLNLTAISCQTLHLRSLFFQVQGHFMHKEPNFLGLFGTKHHLLWDPYICICILFWVSVGTHR